MESALPTGTALKRQIALLTMAAAVLAVAPAVEGQSRPLPRSGSAENSLVGIALYDTGIKVVQRFGSPDQIQGLNVGTGGGDAGGGRGGDEGGAGRGAPSRGGPTGSTPGGNAASWMNEGLIGDPFSMGNTDTIYQAAVAPAPPEEGGGAASGGRGGPGAPAGRGGGGGGGVGGGGGGDRVILTRWIYNRKGSRYAFVLDKFNRVLQIEALGLSNASVRTRRGTTFGATFSSVIQKYRQPDAYEVNGDNFVVRFLVRDRVAFRFSRIDPKKPHVVTGIVVAAGKS